MCRRECWSWKCCIRDRGIERLRLYTRVPCYVSQDTIPASATRGVYFEANDPRSLYVCSNPILGMHFALPVASRRAFSPRYQSAAGASLGANESELGIGHPCHPVPNMASAISTNHAASTSHASCEDPEDARSEEVRPSPLIQNSPVSTPTVTNEAVSCWPEQRPGRPSRRALPTEV